ncbi:MAG TPA: citrate synthase [Streptosporangiaceae bacterium]|nr:citrate synthase [Streptosporangiaceae bacterium]
MNEWIGTTEAARRLGIKEASLYAYVSRGLLSSRKTAGSRTSEFNAADVERLARRGRPRAVPRGGRTAAELVIETALTEIADDQLRYRGIDAIALAAQASLEDVAHLLWTGSLPEVLADGGEKASWTATVEAVAIGTAAQAALPAPTLPLERLQVIVPALAAADPLRLHLDPPAVAAAGRGLVAGMVECLPPAGPAGVQGGRPPAASTARALAGGSIAERLITKLCPDPAQDGLVDVLRATLVLLADHELAASTLAARVAASVRADPYAVVATGLGAVGGALHGGASFGAETMLRSADTPRDAPRVVGDLLRRGERIPGFGHFVYQGSDPRGVFVFERLRQVAPDSERLAVAQAVMAEAARRALPAPNIDFALAAFGAVGGMISGAAEAIFAVARAVGWIAHALEQYERQGAIRPRGIYTGPSPAV